MFEEDGQGRLNEIIDRAHDSDLNDYERKFIQNILGKPYWNLTRHEKIVVNRIYGWLKGQDSEKEE